MNEKTETSQFGSFIPLNDWKQSMLNVYFSVPQTNYSIFLIFENRIKTKI